LNLRKGGKKRTRAALKVGRIIGIFYPPFTHIPQRFGRYCSSNETSPFSNNNLAYIKVLYIFVYLKFGNVSLV